MKIYYSPTLPVAIEHALVTKYNMCVAGRHGVDYITLQKSTIPCAKPADPPSGVSVTGKLTLAEEERMRERCDLIVDFYQDPFKAEPAILQKLHNLGQALSIPQREYIEHYIKKNFPQTANT